ncbi:MAG TPA: orotidine 5'-phosphate decarboxylase / HUMPS family protein, partial [Micropepsaceae bacterium]|nr:orotidine 5'-phosphate decarboxylase / HUMPS family protein [Micropepsaceae bacterium]
MMRKDNPIFVALDTPSLDAATALAAQVAPYAGGLKLGLEFVSANGPEGVRTMVKSGLPVFLDVKLHDIPNTVAGAMKALAPLGAAIINVHASGGGAMMRA